MTDTTLAADTAVATPTAPVIRVNLKALPVAKADAYGEMTLDKAYRLESALPCSHKRHCGTTEAPILVRTVTRTDRPAGTLVILCESHAVKAGVAKAVKTPEQRKADAAAARAAKAAEKAAAAAPADTATDAAVARILSGETSFTAEALGILS